MPRQKIHATTAARQQAYRERREHRIEEWELLRDELAAACENGRCSGLVGGLSDEPRAAMVELTRRLKTIKLVVCKRE